MTQHNVHCTLELFGINVEDVINSKNILTHDHEHDENEEKKKEEENQIQYEEIEKITDNVDTYVSVDVELILNQIVIMPEGKIN